MSQDSGNKGQTGQSKEQQSKPNIPKCPICNTRALPNDREACLMCQPTYSITNDLTRGANGWQLIVQTYKNGVQENVSFAVDVSGHNIAVVKAHSQEWWEDDGLAVIPLKFSEQARIASLHVVGGMVDIRELKIPAEKPAGFKAVKPDHNHGFWYNLMKGLRG